jgi:hypothetical protein
MCKQCEFCKIVYPDNPKCPREDPRRCWNDGCYYCYLDREEMRSMQEELTYIDPADPHFDIFTPVEDDECNDDDLDAFWANILKEPLEFTNVQNK